MRSTDIFLVPGVVLILTGLVLQLMPAWLRRTSVVVLPPLLLVHIWNMGAADIHIHWLEFQLTLLRPGSSGLLFASVFLIALWGGGYLLCRMHLHVNLERHSYTLVAPLALACVVTGLRSFVSGS